MQVILPQKIIDNFSQPARHRIFKGGRGSGKTRSLAKMSAIYCYKMAEAGREGNFLCSREHLNSLDDSSLEEVKAAIASEPWLADYFEVGEKFVRTKNRRVSYVFAGLRRNLDSIKSKARLLANWTDEAEQVSEAAWRKLIPTIREDDSENWVSYNPESKDSATHKRFIESPPTDCVITEINWRDNLFFPKVLEAERQNDLRLRPELYEHIWEGDFLSQTDAQVFAGKWKVEDFDVDADWDGPYFGIDFGFRPDPLAAVKVWVAGESIYIEKEAYGPGVEIDKTFDFINDRMPEIRDFVSRADSAEPKTISYLRRNGLPRMEAVKKWPNSVIEGIRWLRGFQIVIHPDCKGTARDFRLYSHKIDRLTDDILPDVVDANNHGPDAIRYALAPLIKQSHSGTVRFKL